MSGISLIGLVLLAACVGPQGKQADTATYLLSAALPAKSTGAKSAVTVLVTPMRAHPGFDTPRMAYVREANRIEYYAYHRWVETPARMLTPLIAQALESGGAFGAVVQSPASVRAKLRLDTELVSLMQDFTQQPSRVRLIVRAQLVDAGSGAVIATRTFEAQENATAEAAYGGAAAANRATAEILSRLSDWCAAVAK
ncbi:MAG: membrane integrity-associated transporter subunit PqiC [Hydrogenophilales bacterium]|nr:membrane integrity-associated transporter subunit PqiC [Hydrogenophilales bacterium]